MNTNPLPEAGIYLNMPEAEYHSFDALSKSLIKDFIVSPRDAWLTVAGEDREVTEEMTFGTAFHKLVLEGRKAFDEKFFRAFDKSEHPDALDTIPQIKDWIQAKGAKPVTGNKPALVAQALELNSGVEILDALKEKYEMASAGKHILPADQYDRIVARAPLFEKWEWASGMKAKGTEVSLFWFDDELECDCKARLDLVAFTEGEVEIWDLKTFGNRYRKPILKAVLDAINYDRYFIDGYFYRRAFLRVPWMFQDVKKAPAGWIRPEPEDVSFSLLFVENNQTFPNVIPVAVDLVNMGSLTEVGRAADATIRSVAADINDLRKADAADPEVKKPWRTIYRTIFFSDEDLNPYILP